MVEASLTNATALNMTLSNVVFDAEVGFTSRGVLASADDDDAADTELLDPMARQKRLPMLKPGDSYSHMFYVALAPDEDGVCLLVLLLHSAR